MIGDRIRLARKQHGWTQEQLAETAGIAREQISRYEKGKSVPDTSTIQKLSDALNCSFSDLADDPPAAQVCGNTTTTEGGYILSLEEKQIVIDYRSLSPAQRAWIRTALDGALLLDRKMRSRC